MLHALVVQFTRSLARRAIAVRQLDFALRAHTKVWRLGNRVACPPHERHALELSGGVRLSKRVHFEGLLERFSGDRDGEDQDDDDVPIAMQAGIRKGNATDRDEQEDGNDDSRGKGHGDAGVQQQQQQQQAGRSKDPQVHESTELRWSTNYRTIYSPFVYAPAIIAPAHPFGVYAPGTTPESLGSSTHAPHVTEEYEH